MTRGLTEAGEHVIEATLAADGDQTIPVLEERGMPLDQLTDYGAGWQVHAQDLAAHLAGRERCDTEARWDELLPAYKTWRPTSARHRPPPDQGPVHSPAGGSR